MKPCQDLIKSVEDILCKNQTKTEHRNSLLSRVAAFRLENLDSPIDVSIVFHEYLQEIKNHYFEKKRVEIDQIILEMINTAPTQTNSSPEDDNHISIQTFKNMKKKYGYCHQSVLICLKALVHYKSSLPD